MCYFSVICFVSRTVCNKTGFSNPVKPAAHLWRTESVLYGILKCAHPYSIQKAMDAHPHAHPPAPDPKTCWGVVGTGVWFGGYVHIPYIVGEV